MVAAVIGLHALFAAGVLAYRPARAHRRVAAAALVFAIPFAGCLLAWLALRTEGRAEIEPPPGKENPILSRVPIRALVELCHRPVLLDALGGDRETRRSAMATLAATGGAESEELLRWMLERGDGDAVVEAALTLEEIKQRRIARLEEAHAHVQADPSGPFHLAAAEAHAECALLGRGEGSDWELHARTARRYYEQALARMSDSRVLILGRLARLELELDDPYAALAVTDRALTPNEASALSRIRRDALFAARRLPGPALRRPLREGGRRVAA